MTSTAMPTNADLRDFLMLPTPSSKSSTAREAAAPRARSPSRPAKEQRLKYLTDEPRIKALTVLFSDLEGRLHMLDYDKKFLLKSHDNLTFDGSSIRGFTPQRESDLRLSLDWSGFIGDRRTSSDRARCSSSATSSTAREGLLPVTFAAHSRSFANECYTQELRAQRSQ